MTNRNKLIITIGILLLAGLMFSGWLDETGRHYTDEGIKRTLITYGVARGLNGVISVAQGTEVSVEPVGVGVTFTPGEILDPINDLVEQFSWIVLASGVSLGAQRILISMTGWPWFGVAVGILLLISLLSVWRARLFSATTKQIIYKTAFILAILRLSVPVIAVLNEGVYDLFLAPQYEDSRVKLEETSTLLENVRETPPAPAEQTGIIDRARQVFNSASDSVNVERRLEKLKQTASDISEYVLNLMVVFILQTLIFPLLFLWLTYRLIVRVISYPSAIQGE